MLNIGMFRSRVSGESTSSAPVRYLVEQGGRHRCERWRPHSTESLLMEHYSAWTSSPNTSTQSNPTGFVPTTVMVSVCGPSARPSALKSDCW